MNTKKIMKRSLNLLIALSISIGSIVLVSKPLEVKATVQNDEAATIVDNYEDRSLNFNSDWKFSLEGEFKNASAEKFDDSSWQKLNLPHDWSIFFDFDSNSPAQNEGGLLNGGTGWYRKKFILKDDIADKNVRIHFGGIFMDSTVYVNGQTVGNYPNGYTPFSYDITEYLNPKGEENTIAVKVVNRQPSSRWYSGSGIYRDVHLIVSDNTHVKENGNYFITPNLSSEVGGEVTVNASTKVQASNKEVQLQYHLLDSTRNIIQSFEITEKVNVNGEEKIDSTFKVSNPSLWSIENPNMYIIKTDVLVNGEIVDTTYDRFGFRFMDWTPDGGFKLNGNYIKFQGVSMHHDQGALGAVANYDAMYRQMRILKDMGVNSVRVTHNPADDKLIEIAEDLGILIIDEAFDTWYGGKKTYDYGRFFEKNATHPDAKKGQTWAEFDLKQMVERGKNSPAIIMWSLGNEIGESNGGSAKAVTTARNLNKWVKEVDETRYTTIGQDVYRWAAVGGHEAISAEFDAVGLNYAEDNYAAIRAKHPDWLIYGSETASATTSRGVYAFPDEEKSHDNSAARKFQQSDYGNDRVGWGKTATNALIPDRDNIGYAGQFVWTGFDYIGEPTPWHNQNATPPKSSYFGIVDTAGFPKNSYYLYQSQWKSVETDPMVHIFPHWNWESEELLDYNMRTKDGKIPVRIYSNAPSVELFLNGESLGTKNFTQKETNYAKRYQEGNKSSELYLEWRLDFTPGELVAVAKDSAGNEIARDKVVTSKGMSKIKLQPESRVISANGSNLSYIEVNVVDDDGILNPNAQNNIKFNISGDGVIVGVDNGNPASRERYKAQQDGTWERQVFNGKAIVIVQSTTNEGKFILNATADDLQESETSVFTNNGSRDDVILGYDDIYLTTDVGVQPLLPKEVTAILSNGMEKNVDVVWDNIKEENIEKPGNIIVKGKVKESDVSINAYVSIRGVSKILDTRISTGLNMIPSLPKETRLIYTNGQETLVPVTWDEIRMEDVSVLGTVDIKGSARYLDNEYDTVAHVSVLEKTLTVENIAVRDGVYPIASSSHNPSGGDSVSKVNDGIIEFANRWTNWTNGGIAANESETVTLEFENQESINSIGLHIFTDGQTKEPQSIVVSTSLDGINFTDVINQSQKSKFNVKQGDVETEYPITFENTNAKYIRLTLQGQKNGENYRPLGLSEIKVYAERMKYVPDSNAELKSLTVGDKNIEIIEGKLDYIVDVDFASKDSLISATSNVTAGVEVIQPTKENGYVGKVIVTSQDGSNKKVYSLKYRVETPKLNDVILTLDRSEGQEDETIGFTVKGILEDGSIIPNDLLEYNLSISPKNGIGVKANTLELKEEGSYKINANVTYFGENKISETVALKVNKTTVDKKVINIKDTVLSIDKGERPKLPDTVEVEFDKGFAKMLPVEWEEIQEEQLSKYGEFTIQGKVKGSEINAKAIINVNGIVATETFSTATPVGKTPKLPISAKAYTSDHSIDTYDLAWESINSDKLNETGEFTLEGTLIGTNVKTSIRIRVSNDTKDGSNIAQQWTGSDLPAGIASYTNDGANSSDRISAINDTIISYNNSPANRWTNWTSSGRNGDWIGILFADAGSMVPRFVDNMQIAYFKDSGTAAPDSFKVEYYLPNEAPKLPTNFGHIAKEVNNPLSDDNNWKEVSNIQAHDVRYNEFNKLTFDGIETYAIRINMKSEKVKGLAVSELEVYDRIVDLNGDFEASFVIDGEVNKEIVLGDTNNKIELRNHAMPKIEVKVTDNASTTIVYDELNQKSAKVIIKSEDGKKIIETEINFDYSIADKREELHMLIQDAKKLNSNDYTGESFGRVVAEIQNSIKVYENDTNGVTELNLSIENLNNAIDGLVPIDKEIILLKEELENLIEKAEQIKLENYTPDSVETFTLALNESKAVLASDKSSKEELRNVLSKLENTILNLVEKEVVNPTNHLKNFIEILKKANEINVDEYTGESLKEFIKARTNAQALFDRLEIENISDEELVELTMELQSSMDKLIKKDDQVDPTDPTNPTNPTDPTSPTDPTDRTEKVKPTEKGQANPATSVQNQAVQFSWLILLSIGVAGIIILKKKKQEK